MNPKSVITCTIFLFLLNMMHALDICCVGDDDSILYRNTLVECYWCGSVTYSVCCFSRPFYLNK